MELDIPCSSSHIVARSRLIAFQRCEEFARQGCKVYASSRRIESIEDFGGDATIERIALDVTSDESVRDVLNHIIEKEGKIDVVVNNAGFIGPGTD